MSRLRIVVVSHASTVNVPMPLTTYIQYQVDFNMDPKDQTEHIESTVTCEGKALYILLRSMVHTLLTMSR